MQENILIVQYFFHSYNQCYCEGNERNEIGSEQRDRFFSFDYCIIITIKTSFMEKEQVNFTKNKVILRDCYVVSTNQSLLLLSKRMNLKNVHKKFTLEKSVPV